MRMHLLFTNLYRVKQISAKGQVSRVLHTTSRRDFRSYPARVICHLDYGVHATDDRDQTGIILGLFSDKMCIRERLQHLTRFIE